MLISSDQGAIQGHGDIGLCPLCRKSQFAEWVSEGSIATPRIAGGPLATGHGTHSAQGHTIVGPTNIVSSAPQKNHMGAQLKGSFC